MSPELLAAQSVPRKHFQKDLHLIPPAKVEAIHRACKKAKHFFVGVERKGTISSAMREFAERHRGVSVINQTVALDNGAKERLPLPAHIGPVPPVTLLDGESVTVQPPHLDHAVENPIKEPAHLGVIHAPHSTPAA